MKNQATTLFILMLVMALPGLLHAQGRAIIKAEVPFEFVAGTTTMPAGECTITPRGNAGAYLFVDCQGRQTFIVPNASQLPGPSATTELVFHRYGDRYFLSRVQPQGNNRGYEMPAGKAEKELRAQVAENDVTLIAAAR